MPRAMEEIHAWGDRNVRSLHRTTFEVTKEEELSPSGDCIIAVSAEKGSADLSPAFRSILQQKGSRLTTTLTCGDQQVVIISEGSPEITLTHPTDIVWRRSAFTCWRTIGIYSDRTAGSLPREFVRLLQQGRELIISLVAESAVTRETDIVRFPYEF